MHTVNNLSEDEIFHKQAADKLCKELAPGANWRNNPHQRGNRGNYDINVLEIMLNNVGLDLSWMDNRFIDTFEVLPNYFGIVINKGLSRASRHWYCFKKKEGEWYLMDSLKKGPKIVTIKEIKKHVIDVVKDKQFGTGNHYFLIKPMEEERGSADIQDSRIEIEEDVKMDSDDVRPKNANDQDSPNADDAKMDAGPKKESEPLIDLTQINMVGGVDRSADIPPAAPAPFTDNVSYTSPPNSPESQVSEAQPPQPQPQRQQAQGQPKPNPTQAQQSPQAQNKMHQQYHQQYNVPPYNQQGQHRKTDFNPYNKYPNGFPVTQSHNSSPVSNQSQQSGSSSPMQQGIYRAADLSPESQRIAQIPDKDVPPDQRKLSNKQRLEEERQKILRIPDKDQPPDSTS